MTKCHKWKEINSKCTGVKRDEKESDTSREVIVWQKIEVYHRAMHNQANLETTSTKSQVLGSERKPE